MTHHYERQINRARLDAHYQKQAHRAAVALGIKPPPRGSARSQSLS